MQRSFATHRARWLLVTGVATVGLVLAASAAASPGKTPADLKRVLKAIKLKSLFERLQFLAADDMEGREAGSPGAHRAAQAIAAHYERCGLEPMGSEGFFQPFGGTPPRGKLADANTVEVARSRRGERFRSFSLGDQLQVAAFSGQGTVRGRVVFAGYGISAEEYGYDDYADMDVEGKLVLVLDHEPQERDPGSIFDGVRPTRYSEIRYKAENARDRGALGLLVVRDVANHPDEPGLPKDDELAWPPPGETLGIPVVYLGEEAAAAITKPGRKDLEQLQLAIDGSLKTSACDLRGFDVVIQVSAEGPVIGGQKNIIALKRGTDETLRDQYVVIGAHYDHVGRGTRQNSKGGIGQIHNGADDNASGTSGLMEVASALKRLKLKRSVLLMSFDAEEKGLLGSKHFVANPTVPLDRVVTILNMDMISRNAPDEIFVGGMGRNARLDEVVKDVSQRYKLRLRGDGMEQYLQRSDQWPFMERGVPGLFFFGGTHPDYHTANDTADKCNVHKMRLITQVVLVFLYDVANGSANPRGG